jgi:hypothetical protein
MAELPEMAAAIYLQTATARFVTIATTTTRLEVRDGMLMGRAHDVEGMPKFDPD